jgi:O-antigen/teichoic acid export membrane protein
VSSEIDEPQRLRRDVAWNLVPVALLAGVGLGLNFVIGAWWGEAALGSFNLVTTALFAFAVVGAGGLQYAVLRAVAEDPADRERVAAVVVGAVLPNIVLAAVTTLVFVALRGAIGGWLQSPAVAEGMLWAAPGLFCFSLNKTLLCVVNGLRRMRAFAIYTSLRYSMIAVGLVLARVFELHAEQLPVIWSLVEGALLLVLVGELLIQVSLRKSRGWLAHARAHLDFGSRGVLATLALEINSKLDVWLLGVVLTDAQVGIYSLAAALCEGAQQLGVVLQNNVNPLIARALAGGRTGEVEDLARRIRRWFVPAFVGICLIAALLYPVVVPWLIGKESFAAGSVPFAIMMGGLALASPYLPFNQLLLMASRPGWYTAHVLVVVAANLVANLVLIDAFDTRGAAAAMATSFVISALVLRAFARWRVGVRL